MSEPKRLTPELLRKVRDEYENSGIMQSASEIDLLDHIDALEQDNERLRRRTHELQEQYSKEIAAERKHTAYWNDLRTRVDDVLQEPNIAYQSANVRAAVANLVAERDALTAQVALACEKVGLEPDLERLIQHYQSSGAAIAGSYKGIVADLEAQVAVLHYALELTHPHTLPESPFPGCKACAALADTEAAAKAHDREMRREGAQSLYDHAIARFDADDSESPSRLDQHLQVVLAEMEREANG